MTQIVVDLTSPQTVYSLADSKICKSSNGGREWSILSPDSSSTGVLSLAIDPSRPGRVFAGLSSGGIARSNDGGATWERLASADSSRGLWADPSLPDVLYAAGPGGVSRSLDDGSTWSRLNLPGQTPDSALLFAVAPSGTAYVWLSSTGLFRSLDRGENWAQTSESPAPFSDARLIVVDPAAPATLYVVTSTGLFRSSDTGASWDRRGGGNASSLAVDPRDSNALYAGAVGGVWRTRDAGRTWLPPAQGSSFPDLSTVTTLAVDPRVGVVYAGLSSDVARPRSLYRSEDGGVTWARSDLGLPPFSGSLAVDPLSSAVYVVGDGVFKTQDSGNSWQDTQAAAFEPPTVLAIDPIHPMTVYVGTGTYPNPRFSWQGQGRVQRTDDGGRTWTTLVGYGLVSALAVNPRDPSRLYVAANCINLDLACGQPPMRSVDGGRTWQVLESPPPGIILKYLFDPTSQDIYASTAHLCTTCFPFIVPKLFRSSDDGASWSPAGELPDTSGANLIFDRSSGTLYAATASGLYRSSNRGDTWTRTGLTVSVHDLAIDPWDPGVLYASTGSAGVLRSLDGGSTWEPLNTGLPDLNVGSLVIDGAGAYLHASVSSAGVYDLAVPRRVHDARRNGSTRIVGQRK